MDYAFRREVNRQGRSKQTITMSKYLFILKHIRQANHTASCSADLMQ